MKTFIYEDTEVKLTGREAYRVVNGRTFKKVEITPVDTMYDWKKWIDPAQLYEVH